MNPTNNKPAKDEPAAPPAMAPPPPSVDAPPPADNSLEQKTTVVQKLAGPKMRMLVFALVFAGIGGYFIFRSYAAETTEKTNILAAINKLKDGSVQTRTSFSINYPKGDYLRTAGLTNTTYVDKFNNSYTEGQMSLRTAFQVGPAITTLPWSFPYRLTSVNGNDYMRLSNTAYYKKVLPAGSDSQKWFADHDAQLKRLENNWYKLDNGTQNAAQSSTQKSINCLTTMSLVSSPDDLAGVINQSLSDTDPITVTSTVSSAGTTTYTLKPSSAANQQAFVSRLVTLPHTKDINSCAQQLMKVNLTDKLSTSSPSANMTLTVIVDKYGHIYSVTYSNAAPTGSAAPDVTIKATVTYGYKTLGPYDQPVNAGDFTNYFKQLTSPTDVQSNSYFSYQLPTGWTGDNCPGSNQYLGVSLFTSLTPTAAYCAYGDANISIDRASYTSDGTSSAGQAAKRLTNALAVVKARHPVNSFKELAPTQTTHCKPAASSSKVTIDGKQVTRTAWTYKDCSKEINYDYYQDDTASNTGATTYFQAWYYQLRPLLGADAAFDTMVKAIDFKF